MAEDKQIQSLTGIGGMDYDSDDKYIQEGDYHYIVNGIKIGVGEDGVILNAPGNENVETVASTFLVDNSGSYVVDDLDTVTSTQQDGNIPASKIVGHCKDPKRNGIILLLQGASTSSIYEFFAAGQIYVPIIKSSSVIHFSSDVVDATVIGDRLYWLERGGEPRTINIKRAYNTYHNKGGDTYDSIDADVVSLIKRPPIYTIDTEFGYDSDHPGSNVYKKIYQFRQQYIYEDDLKSSFGNTSGLVFNKDVFVYGDQIVKQSTSNNFVDIKFNSGHATAEKIRIAAREGNNGEWFEIAVLKKDNPQNVVASADAGVGTAIYVTSLSDNTEYYYRFYNHGGYRVIPRREIEKPYEVIPIESNHMGAYENNSLIFGKNKFEYDSIDIGSSSIEPNYYARSGSTTYNIGVSSSIGTPALDGDTSTYKFNVNLIFDLSLLPDILPAGTEINMKAYVWGGYSGTANNPGDGTPQYYCPDRGSEAGGISDETANNTVTLSNSVTKDFFANNITDYIDFNTDKSYNGETGAQQDDYDSFSYNSTTNILTITWNYDSQYQDSCTVDTENVGDISTDAIVGAADILPSLKRGRYVEGAIQYIDKYGRRCEPITTENTSFLVEEYYDTPNKGAVGMEFALQHTPPDWAYHYQFLYSFEMEDHIQVPVLYSMPYLDENGKDTGYIALMVGLTIDALEDVVENEIDDLEKQISELEKRKASEINSAGPSFKPWKLISPLTAVHEGGKMLGLWGDQNESDKGKIQDINSDIKDLERKVELKKYELSNQYKRALANVRNYHFSKNDRIRIIKAGDTNPDSIADYNSTNYTETVPDLQVLDVLDSISYTDDYETKTPTEYPGLWLKVAPPNVEEFTGTVQNSKWDNALIEVYKPSKSDVRSSFYEIGDIYDITNPGEATRAHSVTNSTVRPNNTWFKYQAFYIGSAIDEKGSVESDWLEDNSITHDFRSAEYNIGRVFIQTDISKGVTHNNLLVTNSHFVGTEINGLSQADYDNVKYLSEEYGDIYGIWKSGNTVKVAQAKKITSFYPSADSIFGRMRHSQTDYGTVYPKSMVDSPYGYRYGFDVYNGVIWRDTNNGVYNISGKSVVRGGVSNYKMGKYFRDVAKEVRDNGILKGSDDVIAAYDEKYELVYFSFLQTNLDSNVVPYRTVMFHEPSNRWVGFLDIQPTGYAYGYNTLLSSHASDDNIYLHGREEDTTGTANNNNFYGTQKNFEAEFVANIMPGVQKVFDAMAIHATTQFSVPEMTISSNKTTINEKFSKLNTNHFVLQDGVYKSEILGNMKTTGSTAKSRELYNGERMRGYAMSFKLRSSDSEKFELFKVDVYVDPYAT